jgi:hypothetical protein
MSNCSQIPHKCQIAHKFFTNVKLAGHGEGSSEPGQGQHRSPRRRDEAGPARWRERWQALGSAARVQMAAMGRRRREHRPAWGARRREQV